MHFKKFGKYTIIKKLASGGMADILLANDLGPTGFGRFVVIKRTLSKFSDNEEFIDMFKNEGKVACNLKHRNIIPVYEFGIENDQFFLSMEYISGQNLRELIKKVQAYKNKISIPNSIHIIKEVAAGLNYAHNAIDTNTGKPLNLIHRDVSPQNIMLSFDGEIKLIDFGISKIADTNLTRAGHLKGKFSYMSPEQAYGEVLDERTDIFCLGIILWELLTNKRLFASKNELAALKKVKNCDIPDAQKINPEIPTELNNIVKKALSKNKNVRYKSGAKLEQDLSIFLNKNHPEYSHYEFISLMKKIYRKEIMEEREKLKTYASEFKKYLNTLNIEENLLSTNISLNIPELKTEEERPIITTKEVNQVSKTEQNINPGEASSEYISYLSTQTYQSPKPKTSSIQNNNTTLVQQKESFSKTNEKNTLEEEKPKKANLFEEQTHTKNNELTLKTVPGLIKNQTDFLKATQSLKHSSINTSKYATNHSSFYNKNQSFYKDFQTKYTKKRYGLTFTFLFLLVSAFSIVAYLSTKDYDLIEILKTGGSSRPPLSQKKSTPTKNSQPSIQQTSEADLSAHSYQKNTTKRNLSTSQKNDTQTIKVFINSKPSGAAIFIGKNFSSKYTPSLIELLSNEQEITLKKTGYFPKTFAFNPKQNKQNLTITLDADNQKKDKSPKVEVIQQ